MLGYVLGLLLEEFFYSLFCNFAILYVFLKSQSWLVYSRWNFLLSAWQGRWWSLIWRYALSLSLSLLSFCICYSYNPRLISTVSGCFNSFKKLQCLLFLGFESKRIINYSSLMGVWNVQSNSFPFVYLSCFSHCVGMLISNLSVVMPLIGVE